MPWTIAWVMRSFTGSARQAASSTSALGATALEFLRQIQQPLGGVGTAVEQHILDAFAQRRGNVLIDGQLAGIDDAHIHARLDGVEQKDAECIASRTLSLPRKEKEKFETPPEIWARRKFARGSFGAPR